MEPMPPLDTAPTPYAFTAEELARLSVYKAAIGAGLYTDTRAEPSSFDRAFTVRELERLAVYRTAIQASFYTDFP